MGGELTFSVCVWGGGGRVRIKTLVGGVYWGGVFQEGEMSKFLASGGETLTNPPSREKPIRRVSLANAD